MSEAQTARQAAVGMEAKKDSLRQTQDGLWKVTFTVKPEDMQWPILNAAMGTRYMLAAVELGDNEEAVERKEELTEGERAKGERAKRHFEAMCQDIDFRRWLHEKWRSDTGKSADDWENYRQATKELCGVASANEFLDHPEKWNNLWTEYKFKDSAQ